ncbi:MAG TPA: hypothetical protein VI074_10770 [Propionibacteriaceae bacterium]
MIAHAMPTLAITRLAVTLGCQSGDRLGRIYGPGTRLVTALQALDGRPPQTCLISAALARLTKLGADVTVQLGSENDTAMLADAAGEGGIDVRTISRRGLTHVAPRVRLVEIGQSAGPTLALQADALRSSGLAISGSGAASMPVEKIISELPTFQSWAGGDLQVEVEEIPLADVAAAWLRPNNGRRIVLRV